MNKCADWTSHNYWTFKLQQIYLKDLESDVKLCYKTCKPDVYQPLNKLSKNRRKNEIADHLQQLASTCYTGFVAHAFQIQLTKALCSNHIDFKEWPGQFHGQFQTCQSDKWIDSWRVGNALLQVLPRQISRAVYSRLLVFCVFSVSVWTTTVRRDLFRICHTCDWSREHVEHVWILDVFWCLVDSFDHFNRCDIQLTNSL